MRKSKRPIVIASRRSELARAQAEAVGAALGQMNPGIAVRYTWIESEGDKVLDRPLNEEGNKGMFIKAVEAALLSGEADIAVHSLKDMTTDLTPGLVIAAIPARGDARDCLVARDPAVTSVDALRHGAVVGTASPRRAAQLKRVRPDLQIQLIRGNVQTRLRKVLEDGAFDATLLAVAGLERSGLARHARHPVDPSLMLPAAGQAALAVQCRMDDHVTLSRCLPLNHTITAECVHAERAVIAGLRGDCHSPIAVFCEPTDAAAMEFRLRVRVLGAEGGQMIELEDKSRASGLRRMVKRVVRSLQERGAADLLRAASRAAARPAPQPTPARSA